MKHFTTALGLLLLAAASGAYGQQPARNQPVTQRPASPTALSAADSPVTPRVEAYLRKLYAWGPEFTLTFSTLRQTGLPELYELTVEVARGEQKNSGTIYVSRDGRYLFRGELSDLSKDPLAETRAMLHLEDSPALGPADAPVTLVEFADFQCPACRQLHDGLKPLLARYPQVRLVFKDFPISQIHPWARTAALAGRCVYMQTPSAFWKFYDSVYQNQPDISPENAWEKALQYASEAGANSERAKTCMASSEAADAVDKSFQQGQELAISSTPTVFVNGRRAVGPDTALIEQYIQFELQSTGPKAKRTN
jgi:protein-disulfide isomerase